MGMAKKSLESAPIGVEMGKAAETAVLQSPPVTVVPNKVKAVAFGRELSAYEQLKDRRIGVAGIVQAVIQSPAYAQHLMISKSAEETDAFLRDRVRYWLNAVKEESESI